MKIKKTIQEEKTVEMDIQTPYFAKDNDSYYMVSSESECITVHTGSYSGIIKCATWVKVSDLQRAIECSEQEFQEAFEKVLQNITSTETVAA